MIKKFFCKIGGKLDDFVDTKPGELLIIGSYYYNNRNRISSPYRDSINNFWYRAF